MEKIDDRCPAQEIEHDRDRRASRAVRQALGVNAGDRVTFHVPGDNQVVLSRAEEENDPAIGTFLDFLERDMTTRPEAIVGANAVIDVAYSSGVSMTSWKSMKGTGLAVRKQPEDLACPVCAEMIRRAAVKCRFCGAELASAAPGSAAKPGLAQPAFPADMAQSDTSPRAADLEPLRETNNPQVWLIVSGIFVFLFMLMAIAGG